MDGAISIGRNVGSKPMNAAQWRVFQSTIRASVRNAGGTVYASTNGKGEWEGVPEDNAVVTFGDVSDVDALRDSLVILARHFKQDAIALVLGNSELVGAA